MPFADLPHARIHYSLSGDNSLPALVLSTSLGTNFSIWDAQVPEFAEHFRLLRYDMRGHGQSSVPPPPYSVPDLVSDLLSLVDSLSIDRFHLCGLSVGGMIGITLALKSPSRLRKLVLCSTAVKIGTLESWNARIETVRTHGMKEIAGATPPRWFTPNFQNNSPDVIAAVVRSIESLNPDGYIGGCCAAPDFYARKTVFGNRRSVVVISPPPPPPPPPPPGCFLADQIPGARYLELNASHISVLEDPQRFTNEVLTFLTE